MATRTGRLRQSDRLRRPAEFARVMRRGRRVSGASFVVVALERSEASETGTAARLGITVSRRVGCSVVRNRVKRRIREWFRAFQGSLGQGVDLVVIGRPSAADLTRVRAEEELTRLGRGAVRRDPAGAAA